MQRVKEIMVLKTNKPFAAEDLEKEEKRLSEKCGMTVVIIPSHLDLIEFIPSIELVEDNG